MWNVIIHIHRKNPYLRFSLIETYIEKYTKEVIFTEDYIDPEKTAMSSHKKLKKIGYLIGILIYVILMQKYRHLNWNMVYNSSTLYQKSFIFILFSQNSKILINFFVFIPYGRNSNIQTFHRNRFQLETLNKNSLKTAKKNISLK